MMRSCHHCGSDSIERSLFAGVTRRTYVCSDCSVECYVDPEPGDCYP